MKYKLYITPTFEKKLKSFLKKHPEMEIEIEKILDFFGGLSSFLRFIHRGFL